MDISILPKTFDEFCLEIHIDQHNSTITSDKLILLEKQLRLIDNYFSMNEIEKLNLAEDLSNYIWVPSIDFHQIFEIGRTCIDKFTPSIKISRNHLDTNVNGLNVIACPVNEFCFDKNFNNSQIIIIEQDSINTEAITYELDEAKIIINGRILFAVSKAQVMT